MANVKLPYGDAEDDRSLIRQFLGGNEQAFERLVGRHQQYVFNIIHHTMGETAEAADIAQEVFIKMYRSLSSYHEQAAFSTWLYRIAVNTCLDQLRKEKRAGRVRLDDLTARQEEEISTGGRGEDVGGAAERNEMKAIVDTAIGELPEAYRIVVTLRDINGLSYEEIAGIMKCRVGTVKSRLFNARMKLRDLLSKHL